MHSHLTLALLVCLAMSSAPLHAQRSEVLASHIASLQVNVGDDWTAALPVASLGQQTPVNISFDDLTHEYHRYCYKIEHCESDWSASSQLFTSDYCEGFAEGNTIDDMVESINTAQLYTHYAFQIPNDRCRLKISGNYRVTVYDENDEDRPVLRVCFMVAEPGMNVRLQQQTNTDVDYNGSHQQISMEVAFNALPVTNAATQVFTVLMQNGRWDNAVTGSQPQYVMASGLKWEHNRNFIFPAGNEYHKFELLDVKRTAMGVERIDWDGNQYHAHLWPDEPRPNYVYDEDANGAFIIRNTDNEEISNTTEYVMVHFTLKAPRQENPIFLNAKWTNDQFLPEYEMKWNAQKLCYEDSLMLKQGYYSYQYLTQDAAGHYGPLPSEGSFFQTSNTYQALVYYRGTRDRTDRLVGYADLK